MPTQQPRTIEGPLETRFANQDVAIATIKEDIAKLQAQHETHAQQVKEQFVIAEKRTQSEHIQIRQTMQQMQKEIDHNLANTMQQHTAAMDQQFRDLKILFQQAGKRKNDQEDEDMR
eukprot:s351_g21.t1